MRAPRQQFRQADGFDGASLQIVNHMKVADRPKGFRCDAMALEAAVDGARDDDVLPNSLLDSVTQAGEATAEAMKKGSGRCTAELLIPELWDVSSGPVMAEEGDQMRWWELAREFIVRTEKGYGGKKTRAVFPDMGVGAMLKNRWEGKVTFLVSSLDDREPVSEDDELVIITCPDPPSIKKTIAICEKCTEMGIPVVMFNPRLASGDVGIGTNVRELRKNFTSTFNITYSLYPLSAPSGSVFRKYPAPWQVFLEDDASPGRYNLVAERSTRPAGEELDDIIMGHLDNVGQVGEDGVVKEKSVLATIGGVMVGMQRFMKQLTQ